MNSELIARMNPDGELVSQDRSRRRRRVIGGSIFIVATAIIYALSTRWVGRGGWEQASNLVSVHDIAVMLALVTGGFILRAARWHYYIRTMKWQVPVLPSICAFVAAVALTPTPGKVGELTKALLLRNRYRNVSLSQGAGILLIERLTDLFAVTLIAVGGLLWFAEMRVYVLLGIVTIAVVAVLASRPAIGLAVLACGEAVPKLSTVRKKLMSALETTRALLRPLPLGVGAGVAVVAWCCEGLAFCYLVGRIANSTPPLISLSIFGLSTIAGALSMLPGGIGGFEAVMVLLLNEAGIPTAAATVCVIIFRLLTIWLFSLVGAVFLLGWALFSTAAAPKLVKDG